VRDLLSVRCAYLQVARWNEFEGGGQILKTRDDTALVRRLKEGDARAQREAWDAYYLVVYRYALTRGARRHCAEDAEEITRDAFLRAFQSIDGFEEKASLRTWLLVLAKNAAIDFYRAPRNHYEYRLPESEPLCLRESTVPYGHDGPADGDGALGALLRQETRYQVRRQFAQLSEEQRTVINHRLIAGMSTTETAEQMQRTEGATKMLLLRAIKRLTDLVKDDPYFAEAEDVEEMARHES
jgi:RNA polymerase sigma-70 factor (ECF subfamily)